MAPNPDFLGYLNAEDDYLAEDYLGDTGLHAWGMEVNRQIVDRPRALGVEVNRQIAAYPSARGLEVNLVIGGSHVVGVEVLRQIANRADAAGMEVNRQLAGVAKSMAMEIRRDHSIAHILCEDSGYLQEEYLEGPYLMNGICAHMGMEVSRFIQNRPDAAGMEVNRQIIGIVKVLGMEVTLVIKKSVPFGMEVNRYRAVPTGMQVLAVLYNNTNLRILCDFPSRGTSGTNWSSSSVAAGDFGANNLNTDIVEQRTQSQNGVTSVVYTCDTEVVQGVAIDTLAILGHNFTTSATITVEGSDNAGFSPVEQTFNVAATRRDAYSIAPTFPTIQSRYWRIIVSDPTNPDSHLYVGTVIFGTSVIFQGECFTDNVRRKKKHFSDKVATEGFTNVSNDRALKRAIGLEFRFLEYVGGNWEALDDLFDTARTSLKCLWIPDPQDVERFAVFGKLVDIPDELHRNMGDDANNTLDITIDVDEST